MFVPLRSPHSLLDCVLNFINVTEDPSFPCKKIVSFSGKLCRVCIILHHLLVVLLGFFSRYYYQCDLFALGMVDILV